MNSSTTLYRSFCRVILVGITALLMAGCSGRGSSGPNGEGDGMLSEENLTAERERRFGEGSIPLAEGSGPFRDIRFGFDSSEIDFAAREDVEFNAEVLRRNRDVRVMLEGHADERGTAEYNMALGQRRARAVQELLISLGTPSSQLSTISYGEEVPLDPNHDEEAWSKNRRVHFSGFGAEGR